MRSNKGIIEKNFQRWRQMWAFRWPVNAKLCEWKRPHTNRLWWNFNTKEKDKIPNIQRVKNTFLMRNGNQINVRLLIGNTEDRWNWRNTFRLYRGNNFRSIILYILKLVYNLWGYKFEIYVFLRFTKAQNVY